MKCKAVEELNFLFTPKCTVIHPSLQILPTWGKSQAFFPLKCKALLYKFFLTLVKSQAFFSKYVKLFFHTYMYRPTIDGVTCMLITNLMKEMNYQYAWANSISLFAGEVTMSISLFTGKWRRHSFVQHMRFGSKQTIIPLTLRSVFGTNNRIMKFHFSSKYCSMVYPCIIECVSRDF